MQSYSLYVDSLENWYSDNVSAQWNDLRQQAMAILQKESELDEIVRLVGIDALSWSDRLTLETARMIREDYLHQNAFDDVDTYTSLKKQEKILRLILLLDEKGHKALEDGVLLSSLLEMPVRESLGRSKYIPEDEIYEKFEKIEKDMLTEFANLDEEGSYNA